MAAASLVGPPRNSIHVANEAGLKGFADDLAQAGFAVEEVGTGPHALDAFGDPARTLLVVAGVERSFSPGEVEALAGFVARGGTALVADDFGFGDSVAVRFGVNFDGRVLRDEQYRGNLSLPVFNATIAPNATSSNATVVMNVPTSLGIAPDTPHVTYAESGTNSYLDANQDGTQQPDDVQGPFPVILGVRLGQGEAIFASDPGFLQTGLWRDNRNYTLGLLRAKLPDGGVVVFDESRHAMGPVGGLMAALLAGEVQATSEPFLALILGGAIVVLAGMAYAAFRGPESMVTHRSRLQEPAHEANEALDRARIRRLAGRAIADANNLSVDERRALTPAQLAQQSRDPAIQALLLDQPAREPLPAILQRLRTQGGR
jgi:hypothetical protein